MRGIHAQKTNSEIHCMFLLKNSKIVRFASKIIGRCRMLCWRLCRKSRNCVARKRLNTRGRNVSILSMNCTGGILSHDLGLQFRSPTINLYMCAEDFIKFCENLEHYLAIDQFEKCTDKSIIGERTYPVAFLGDLTLFLVHYHSILEAEKKWNERKKRLDKDNLVILNTDREGMSESLKERFEYLPYRKVMFTHLPDNHHPSCFYIRGYEQEDCVGIITEPHGCFGMRAVDQFDYITFFNTTC